MTKLGILCFGGFERGSGTYWEVRRIAARAGSTYVVYRTRDGVTEEGRFDAVQPAWEMYSKHVPNEVDMEAALSR